MDTITYWCVKYVITENGGAGNRVKGKGLNITTRSCFKSIISNPHGVRCMFSWAWGSAEQNASLMPVLIKVFDHKYFYGLSVQLLQQFWQRSSCSYQHLSPHITQCVQSFYLLSLVDLKKKRLHDHSSVPLSCVWYRHYRSLGENWKLWMSHCFCFMSRVSELLHRKQAWNKHPASFDLLIQSHVFSSVIICLCHRNNAFVSRCFHWQIIGKYLTTAPHYNWVVISELGALHDAQEHNWDMFSCDSLRTAPPDTTQCSQKGRGPWVI